MPRAFEARGLHRCRCEWSIVLEFEQISEEQLAEEILRYFLEHPHAADGLEGIAKWRLSRAMSGGLARISAALRRLVEHSFLEEIQILGSSPVFRLNQANQARAKSFLEGDKRRSDEDSAGGYWLR